MASAKQIAWRKKFARMSKAGEFRKGKKSTKSNPRTQGSSSSTLINEIKSPGTYSIHWNANNFPSGVYFVYFTATINGLKSISKILEPQETILVADSLTGQDAANNAKNISKTINISAIILTRVDGDGRGGAALSIKSIT